MIHCHGTPIGGTRQDVARFLVGRHALIPFGRQDDTGAVLEFCQSFVLDNGAFSHWKKGHGAIGEGGGKGSFFYTKRYAISSGLNSPNLDFLPLVNIEDDEIIGGGLGAIAIGACMIDFFLSDVIIFISVLTEC